MDTYLPLKLVNKWSDNLPTCWEEIENMRSLQGSTLPNWDDTCYIPISATIAVASRGVKLSGLTGTYIDGAQQLAALAPWRKYKEVYRFTPEMEELLFTQADDLIIPIETLQAMPFPCLYIEFSSQEFSGKYHGFFVHIEDDPVNIRKELRFLLLENDGTTRSIPVHLLPGGTIKDGIEAMSDECVIQNRKQGLMFDAANYQQFIQAELSVVMKLIQLVLYICAQNAEVDENPGQKKITRKPSSQENPKDKFREIRKWDVGIRITKAIRSISQAENYIHHNQIDGPDKQSISFKRPHARCGHWHHFWTGQRSGKDRKLILKWVAPTFINANTSVDAPVTIREVDAP